MSAIVRTVGGRICLTVINTVRKTEAKEKPGNGLVT